MAPGGSTDIEPGLVVAIILIVAIIALIFFAISITISTIYRGMVAYAAVQTSKHHKTTIGEAFNKTIKKFWTLVWLQIIVFFKVLGGTLLFIIPGIRAALRYDLVMLPVFAEDADAKKAIKTMKNITNKHLMEVLGMSFAAGIIPFVGELMHAGGQAIMYPQLKHIHAHPDKNHKTHWLNYLVFMFVGSIFALILLIAMFVVLIVGLSS
jgi:hypothetical protein